MSDSLKESEQNSPENEKEPEIEGKVEGEEGIDETNEPLDTDNLTGDISYINIDPEN